MAFTLSSLRELIALLRQADPGLMVFGADEHAWTLVPYASTDVVAFEAEHGPVPPQYRALLLELGTGAGPYYGLRAPAAMDAESIEHEPRLANAIVLAEQGCGDRSVLLPNGEVWTDGTREGNPLTLESSSVFAWLAAWMDRALTEWTQKNAARIALEGPENAAELEAVALGFELVQRGAPTSASLTRTLGYLHVRERRWEDARAAFDAAAAFAYPSDVNDGDVPIALRHRDVARMYLAMGLPDDAIKESERGLAVDKIYYSTRDELRAVLEDAYGLQGNRDAAIAILDARCAERFFSFDLHHRLARERIARGDIAGAGDALERAAGFANIAGIGASLDERLAASFEPIIAELHGAKRSHDGALLEALVARIRNAN